MTEARVLLEAAAFMESPQAQSLQSPSRADILTTVQRFLRVCYIDLGKAPRFLDGTDVQRLLCELLPLRYPSRCPLAAETPKVLKAYRAYLRETVLLSNAFEMDQAFDAHETRFVEIVSRGQAHRDGRAAPGPADRRVFRGSKVGRNDPCPCGSGKKFKKCCQRLGGSGS